MTIAAARIPIASPKETFPIRVLVVDDHAAVRMGLAGLLDEQPDLLMVDAVASAEAALVVAEREAIDVAVVDYQLRGRNGLWVSRKLKRLPRPPRVLIYSGHGNGVLAAACVVAEADGLVNKASRGDQLCEAIRAVAEGRQLLLAVPPQVGELLRQALDAEDQAIFGMLLAGLAPAEVARTLGIAGGDLQSRLWSMLRTLEGLAVPSSRRS